MAPSATLFVSLIFFSHVHEKSGDHIQIHLRGGSMAKKVEAKAAAAKKATKKVAKTAAKKK